jgi:hypothetical protein
MPGPRAVLRHFLLGLAVFALAGPAPRSQEKPSPKARIHITYMESWDAARPRRRTRASRRIYKREGNAVELPAIIKGFQANCPEVTVTETEETAGYYLTVTQKRRGGRFSRRYAVTLTKSSGEVLYSDTTRLFSNSAKAACKIINQDAGAPAPEKEKQPGG